MFNFERKYHKDKINLFSYYFNKGIKIIFIIDQFSKVISLQRNLNAAKSDSQKYVLQDKIHNFKYYLKHFNAEFRLIHYLSSVTI